VPVASTARLSWEMAISGMSSSLARDFSERAISEIALVAYRYFDRIAHSNDYGHKQ